MSTDNVRRRPPKPPEETSQTGSKDDGSTPDALFDMYLSQRGNAGKTYDEAEKDLIVFVEQQVSLMKQNLLFGGGEPSLYELNRVLSQYETVHLGLITLYATVKQEKLFAEERYEDAYASWFVQTRAALSSLGDKKMPSTREIDMIVRSDHMEDLAKLKAAVISTESKRSAIERLCESWKNYSFILNTMSRNAQAEVGASGISGSNLPMDLQDN